MDAKEEESSASAVSLQAQWGDGEAKDFEDLHAAIAEGRTEKFNGAGGDTADSSSEEEEEEEPEAGEPGKRLLWAAQRNRTDVVEEILNAAGPVVDKVLSYRDSDGYSALHRACYSDHAAIAERLLRAGADVCARTSDGWTPLHSACRWNAFRCVEALLAAGADVNAVSEGGQTGLHLAAFHGAATETLELLLSRPEVRAAPKNAQGDSPREIALRRGSKCLAYFDLLADSLTKIDEC